MNDTGTTRPDRGRSTNCFDFLRLFAAVAVVFGHSTHYLGESFLWFAPDSRLWFRDGVTLFFLMSGFLVFRSAERCVQAGRPLWHFWVNRYLRVAPAIHVYVLVVAPLLFVAGVASIAELRSVHYWAWFVSTIALVPVYHPDAWRDSGSGVVNGALWTIPVECSFYVIVPVLALLMRRLGFRLVMTALASVSVLGLAAAFALDVPRSDAMAAKLLSITFLPYLIYFATGIFWSRMWSRVPHSARLALACGLVYVITRILIAAPNERGGFAAYAGVLLWIIPFSYAVMWFGHYGPRVLSRLTARIGDLSFGVYIWHMVVINTVMVFELDRFVPIAPNPLLHLLVLGAALGLAFASWNLIEKPALRLKPFTSRSPGSVVVRTETARESVARPRPAPVATPAGSEIRT